VSVWNSSTPISAADLASAGSLLVAAVTSNGSTYLFSATAPFSQWTPFQTTVCGSLAGIAADPEEVAVVTLSNGSVSSTLFSATGSVLGHDPSIGPSGSGGTGVVDAGVTLTPYGATYLESVVFSVSSSDEIQYTSSTNGTNFNTPITISDFSTESPNPVVSSLGDTSLSWTGGIPGQLSMVSVGSDLFLLFTTNVSGETVPATEVSGNNGTIWSGPYLTNPVNGSVVDPALTVGPTGLVYGTWEEPDYGNGAIDEATYSSDGLSLVPPETLVSSSLNGTSPVSAPAIAVDNLARPLLAWAISTDNGSSGAVAYTGGYLSAEASLNLTGTIVNDTAASPDFTNPGAAGSLITSVTTLLSQVEANLSVGRLCNAQNETAVNLYQNLTHFILATESGSGGVCAPVFHPSALTSPLGTSVGVEVPNTFYAVYVDWALEAEGVPVSTSPLTAVTEVYPYSGLALSAALPGSATTSETISTGTAAVTVTPTPYSPTAYDLAVSDQLPTKTQGEPIKCVWYGGWASGFVGTITTVTATSTKVSVNGGPTHTFTGTTAFPSAWVYNLSADQTYPWSATFSATLTTTTQGFEGQYCERYSSSTSSSIPSMTLSGTFATTLSVAYGAGFLSAKLNGNRTTAQLSLAFNNTLPASVQSSLSNSSGTQTWSSSQISIPETYSFAATSAVGQTYTYSETSTSRAGTSSAPGSPSFAFGSSGAAPVESAGLWCQFTLSAAGPTVWTNNATSGTWPYSNSTGSTVQITWYANEAVDGFFSYHEVGSSIDQTITGIAPVQVGRGNWSYTIEVYGLSSLANYGGVYGVSWDEGCLVEEDQLSGQVPHLPSDPSFQTADPLKLSESDQPFDSVTGEGGGFNLTWQTLTGDKGRSVVSGYVTITNLSSKSWSVTIPISPYEIQAVPPSMATQVLSLSIPLTPYSKYYAKLGLNYSGTTGTQTGTYTFIYHADNSKDGLTNSEKTAGWKVTYAPSGPVVFAADASLSSNLFASSVTIDQGVTLTTNGYSIIATGAFVNKGTVDTGLVDYAACPEYLTESQWACFNLPLSVGGSGGGAFNNTTGSAEAYGLTDGLSTLYTAGGSGGTQPKSGGTPSPKTWLTGNATIGWGGTPWESYVLQDGWNVTQGEMSGFLSGAAGGGAMTGGLSGPSPNGKASGGEGGEGLFVQAQSIVAGSLISSGGPGSTTSCNASSGDFAGGGGGGGAILLAYAGSYTAPTSVRDAGGKGASCPAKAAGAAGGNGQVIPYHYPYVVWPPPWIPVSSPEPNAVIRPVHGNFNSYSTNGLANDYLEKEYGLDPNTVDTAGSGMLDLWNLTFNLTTAPGTAVSAPRGIVVWSEVSSTSWNPWGPEGKPNANGTNITCTSASQCPGNTSASSSTLWSLSALHQFMSLSGVSYDLKHGGYLRGVEGLCPPSARSECYWKGKPDRILTLWGKLSWGANPLASSTPGTGIPDGARVNPLGGTDLQVTVTNWNVTDLTLATGVGIAAYIQANSSTTPEYGNYTQQTNISGSGDSTAYQGSFVVTFPVNPTLQFAQLNLSLVANTGSGLSTLVKTSVEADLENPSLQSVRIIWNNASSIIAGLAFQWQAVDTYAKSPTWIYIPSDNSTLSTLPSGLQRYTGEQNFIELVVNDTAAMNDSPSIPGLPYSNTTNASYGFSLSPGLNNILVPRSAFMSSPLGQSVLNLSSDTAPDLLINATTANSWLQQAWLDDGNGATWFDRVTGAADINNSYSAGSPGYIKVIANTTTVSTNNPSLAGGVPSNPFLERGYSSLAIQAILAANESTASDVESLLAGLLLNSTTGNFTGWLLNATTELPALGLLPAVMAGLANATYVNDGGYGAPTSRATQVQIIHNQWWDFSSDWNWFWNSVSGVFPGASLVWNAVVAAAAFIGDLMTAAVRFAFNLESQEASALERVGVAIVAAFNALLQWIDNHVVKPLLEVALQPLLQTDNSYAASLNTTATVMANQVASSGSVSPSSAGAFGTALEGTLFLVGLGIGVAVEVVLAILTPFDLGPEFLVGLLLQIVVVGALATVSQFAHVIGALSAAAVYSVEEVANQTDLSSSVLNSINWRTCALAFSLAASTTSMALVSDLVRDDEENPLLITGVFVLGIISLGLDASSLIGHAPMLETLAIIAGAFGVALGAVHVLSSTASIQLGAAIATGLALAGLGAAYYHAKG
jgi:hypothetical protein